MRRADTDLVEQTAVLGGGDKNCGERLNNSPLTKGWYTDPTPLSERRYYSDLDTAHLILPRR